MTRAAATGGALFDEFDETGRGPVRTLKLVRDQAYTLLVSIFIPAGPERPWHGERREEELPVTELAAGAPGATSRSLRRSRTARKPHAESSRRSFIDGHIRPPRRHARSRPRMEENSVLGAI